MNKLFFWLFIALFLNVFLLNAQPRPGEYSSTNKKAINLFEKAQVKFNEGDMVAAFKCLNDALELDPNFLDAYFMLANLYENNDETDKAIECLNKMSSIDKSYYPSALYILAELQFKKGLYSEANYNASEYLKLPNLNLQTKPKAEKIKRNAEFASFAVKNPVPFNPINLGKNINSPNKDYLPAFSADEQMLIFARTVLRDSSKEMSRANAQEDFYVSKFMQNEWLLAKNLGYPINTPANEGAQALSPDGQLLVFTGCADKVFGYPEGRNGQGSCDLFFSIKKGNAWSEPRNMGSPLNTKYWDSQPTLSSDGRTIYFLSNRPNGIGGMDIWKSTIGNDGKWSNPENIGPSINTPDDEMSPFIHPDNQSFYFASKGHNGMGGFDLFMSSIDSMGRYSTPKNLGYPINTSGDEFGLSVSSKGDKAYYASERSGGFGDWDIYSFELPVNVRAQSITYFKGKVYDTSTKKALGAKFELIDLETKKTIVESYSDETTGEFLVCIPPNRDYALNASKQGYLFYSDNFSLKSQKSNSPYAKEVPLTPIKPGERVVLKNVFFETNKFDLKPQSIVELNKLKQFLESNPSVKIELSGHTDNVGDKAKNKTLSENRAKAVFDYLISQGVLADRLKFIGYGDTQPIDDNKTDIGRANNRRTEFKIAAY
jgi:outer membrane protein OmpA-like peptidoglycan-associated protein/tetratricopeptide (TPR) repeat protein